MDTNKNTETTYYKWIKSEELGVVEEYKGKTDENGFYVFESGRKINPGFLKEFMMLTDNTDNGIISNKDEMKKFKEPTKSNNILKPKQVDSTNLDKFNKLLKLSDSKEIEIKLTIPDEKTVVMLELFNLDFKSLLLQTAYNEIKRQIDKEFNE